MPSELLLASASPRRAALLRGLGVRFRQIPSGAGEEHDGADPAASAAEVALRKALKVAESHPLDVVIGADTVVVAPDGQPMGKPRDGGEALGMLMRLAGRTHRVVTGVALVGPAGRRTGVETTLVRMRRFGRDEAERYVRSGEPLDKAGAYGIQGRGGLLVAGIEGCYFNVVGLPITLLYGMLTECGAAGEWLGPDPNAHEAGQGSG